MTLHTSLNSGAFLQAYTLMKTLQKHGHDVVFLDTGVPSQKNILLGKGVGAALLLDFGKVRFYCEKWRNFVKDQQVFQSIPCTAEALNQCELVLFGSDEIWNVSRSKFSSRPIFWGQGIESSRKIAYAPSMNQATLAQLKALKYPEVCLRQFDRIMVRDDHTQEVVSQLTPKEVTKVVDPTLLFQGRDYEMREIQRPSSDYILLYAYGSLKNKQQVRNICEFAKAKNLPLVSINSCFDWCDYNVAASPLEFPAWIQNARYVVTETFHGTVFSILFGKAFVSYADDKVKVTELLRQFGMQSRSVKPESNLQLILDTEIDYEKVHLSIEREREHSLFQLMDAITASGAKEHDRAGSQ